MLSPPALPHAFPRGHWRGHLGCWATGLMLRPLSLRATIAAGAGVAGVSAAGLPHVVPRVFPARP